MNENENQPFPYEYAGGVKPMTRARYRRWCKEVGIKPNPQYGIYSDNPPF